MRRAAPTPHLRCAPPRGASAPSADAPAPPGARGAPSSSIRRGGGHAHAAAEEAHVSAALAKLPADATPEQKANAVGARPAALPAPRAGAADDLQRIKGVGPVNEKHLHELGVFHFDQIAAWTRDGDPLGRHLSCVSGPDRPRAMGGAGRQSGEGGRGLKDRRRTSADQKPEA